MIRFMLRLCGAALLLAIFSMPASAQLSGPAVTTIGVNLREGPGTRYRVLQILRAGDEVDVARCTGNWCLVDIGWRRGWVAQAYLRRLIPSAPVPAAARACFYEESYFRGASFCLVRGQSQTDLGAWSERIASVMLHGRWVNADLCTRRNLRSCTVITRDTAVVRRHLQEAVVSVKVW